MQNLKVSSLKRNVTISIAVTMLLVTLLIIISTSFVQNHRAKIQEHEYSKQVELGIQYVVKHNIKDYIYRVRRMVETEKEVADLLKSRDRETLYKLFKPKWDLFVEEQKYFEVMHFHLADGTSFLRMQLPKLFGDDLLSVRPMIREIHSSHKTLHGYETGKHGTAYRIIYPIFDKSGEYIGALEVGLNPQFILNAVHEINGFTGMMFIKEDSLPSMSKPNDITIDGYRLQSKLTPELEKIVTQLKESNSLEDGMEIELDELTYRTHLFVLKDYAKKSKVKILFFQNTTNFGLFRSYLIVGLVTALTIILSGLIWLVYRRIGLYQDNVVKIYEEQVNKLNESEHRFELLYEKAPEAYQSLDIDGNILITNIEWTKELGYTSQEVVGKNFGDFLAPGFREKFKENFPKFKAAGSIGGIEFDMVKKDGEIFTVSFNGRVVKDNSGEFKQTHCIFTNITKQKALREELLFNQEYLQSIFDVVPSIMVTTDGKEVDNANPEMLKFFDYESVEAFKKEHDCICDYFIGDNHCLQSTMGSEHWLDYILSRPNELHKVCMMREDRRHHFLVKAHYLEIDEKKRSVVVFSDVTEVEELGERLNIAVSGTQDGLWDWNLVTGEIYFSPQWKKMLGYEDDELENRFETWEENAHPDDKEAAIHDYTAKMEDKTEVYENVHRMRHKDGSWVWILSRGQTKFDESGNAVRMVGFHTDITKQKKLEDELLSAKNQFEQFMDYLPANIIIKDENLRIVYANKNTNKFFKRDNIVGMSAEELLSPDMSEKIREQDVETLKKGIREDLLEVYDDEGNKLIFRDLAFKIESEEGAKIGIVSIDITKEYTLKENLHEQEELVIVQSRHAAMGEMISMIAHQWRQPISVISMDANNILADIELEMIEEKSLKSTSEDIIMQTQELSKTIDDFRNFFRPENGAQEILVKKLFDDALGVIGKSLENNQVEFVLNLDENKKVTTYTRELMQVFINIIKNAKEALIDKKVEAKKITVYSSEDKKNFKVRICDNAGGINVEIIDKVFNPYFTTKGEKNGTGLGLYMSRTIVEKHLEGSLSVENDDEGACFEIVIPHVIGKEEK